MTNRDPQFCNTGVADYRVGEMSGNGMKLLYAGFDGLDVTFKGRIPQSAIDILERGKEGAIEFKQPQLVEINKKAFCGYVGPTGLRDGGYSFIVDTGELGFKWFFSKSQRLENWGIRVSCRSATLAAYGFDETVNRMYAELDAIGATVLEEAIGRVDFAVDWRMPHDFRLDPSCFAMHGTSKSSTHNETMGEAWRSRRCTGITIGKMPGRQICIYDKRAEIVEKRKAHWWKIWGIDRDQLDASGEQVWRVEIRAGKDHLRKAFGIKTWGDLREKLGDVYQTALLRIRYKARNWKEDENTSRVPDSPLWDGVREKIAGDLFEWSSGAEPGVVKQVMIEQQRQTISAQIVGLSANLAVLTGMDPEQLHGLPGRIAEMIAKHVEGMDVKEFRRKMHKVHRRYEFIDIDGVILDERTIIAAGTSFGGGETSPNVC